MLKELPLIEKEGENAELILLKVYPLSLSTVEVCASRPPSSYALYYFLIITFLFTGVTYNCTTPFDKYCKQKIKKVNK